MESHGGMILTGETEELGEKPVPVPLCPPQIPHMSCHKYSLPNMNNQKVYIKMFSATGI
jgi:hypothetical protein